MNYGRGPWSIQERKTHLETSLQGRPATHTQNMPNYRVDLLGVRETRPAKETLDQRPLIPEPLQGRRHSYVQRSASGVRKNKKSDLGGSGLGMGTQRGGGHRDPLLVRLPCTRVPHKDAEIVAQGPHGGREAPSMWTSHSDFGTLVRQPCARQPHKEGGAVPPSLLGPQPKATAAKVGFFTPRPQAQLR